MPLQPGDRVGPYEVTDFVGEGGMGLVYKARDVRLDRLVAIKLLSPELTKDETAKRRFVQEAKAASSLDHPSICTTCGCSASTMTELPRGHRRS